MQQAYIYTIETHSSSDAFRTAAPLNCNSARYLCRCKTTRIEIRSHKETEEEQDMLTVFRNQSYRSTASFIVMSDALHNVLRLWCALAKLSAAEHQQPLIVTGPFPYGAQFRCSCGFSGNSCCAAVLYTITNSSGGGTIAHELSSLFFVLLNDLYKNF